MVPFHHGLDKYQAQANAVMARAVNLAQALEALEQAWLVSLGDKTPLKGDGVVKSNGAFIPVTITGDLPSYRASESLAATAPPTLIESIETIANHTSANDWRLDDLGTVEGGRRVLLVSNSDVILVTSEKSDRPSVRSASISNIRGNKCATVEGALEPWLRKVLTLDREHWLSQGLSANPAISIFQPSCW